MTTVKTRWLLVGLVCLALWPAYTSAQGGLWETYMAAATKAYQQGNYPETEKQLGAALKEAEGFGPQDLRLATSLNNLAVPTKPRATTLRPSRSTSGRWRFTRRPWDRSTPTWPRASTTWRSFTEPRASMPGRSRSLPVMQ